MPDWNAGQPELQQLVLARMADIIPQARTAVVIPAVIRKPDLRPRVMAAKHAGQQQLQQLVLARTADIIPQAKTAVVIPEACACSDGGYVDSCTPSTSNNGCDKVSCKSVTYAGTTCYIKTETHSTPPASCSTPTCADYYADNTIAVGSNYAYQVSGFVTSCANSCGHPATSGTLNCPEGSIILIKCCR